MNIHVNRPDLAADSIPRQLATQQQRAEKTRQRVCKLREKAFEEIERLIAFLDASDGYSMDEREEAVDDVPCDDNELEFSFCGVTADYQPMPVTEYDDEREGGDAGDHEDDEPECEDEGADHDGREPDEDGEPSLGWTVDGCQGLTGGLTLDGEMGEAARPPQYRIDLNTTIAVERSYRKFIHGLTDGQKAAVQPRMIDSGVVVR